MRRAHDSEATRIAILDAAEEVFLKKGFSGTATSEIAERAGVTKSLIHHHFGSKEGLWRDVKMRRFAAYASKQMDMLRDAPPSLDLVRGSFEFYFRFMEQNPQLVRVMAWMFLEPGEDDCLALDRALMSAGVEKIRQGQSAGFIRKDVDPRFIVFIFAGLAQHWFQDCPHFLQSFDRDGLPKDLNSAYLQDAMKIFLEGVLPRPGSAEPKPERA
jgi:TetR/AcrR family transcriptional regulator